MDAFSKEKFFIDEAPGVNVAKFCHLLEERIWWSVESQGQQLASEQDLPTAQHPSPLYIWLLSSTWGGTESPSSERKSYISNQCM